MSSIINGLAGQRVGYVIRWTVQRPLTDPRERARLGDFKRKDRMKTRACTKLTAPRADSRPLAGAEPASSSRPAGPTKFSSWSLLDYTHIWFFMILLTVCLLRPNRRAQ